MRPLALTTPHALWPFRRWRVRPTPWSSDLKLGSLNLTPIPCKCSATVRPSGQKAVAGIVHSRYKPLFRDFLTRARSTCITRAASRARTSHFAHAILCWCFILAYSDSNNFDPLGLPAARCGGAKLCPGYRDGLGKLLSGANGAVAPTTAIAGATPRQEELARYTTLRIQGNFFLSSEGRPDAACVRVSRKTMLAAHP
jgi:hypothetical protein